jgi:mannose-6-phosphate isomerase-like protein (cupin superfamily)
LAERLANRDAKRIGQMSGFNEFAMTRLPELPTEIAPDGAAVRVLLGVAGGTMAHFELAAGETSRALGHRTVEEIWFVLSGRGELWRRQAEREDVTALEPHVCVTLPRGTHFQFRAFRPAALAIVAVTIPRWPGNDEAEWVDGPWAATR